jgi:hypothetical protein
MSDGAMGKAAKGEEDWGIDVFLWRSRPNERPEESITVLIFICI